MIGADTNLLVRFLVRDDDKQSQIVKSLLEEGKKLYINEVVLTELYWVLIHVYEYHKNDFIYVLDTLLDTRGIIFFNSETVRSALSDYIHSSIEFSDCLIHRINAEKELTTYTFDKKATRLKRMNLL